MWKGLLWAAVFSACPALGSAGEEPDDAIPEASPEDTRREVHLDLATEPMPRNASLAVAGTEAASRALALAARPLLSGTLERRGGWGIASRAAWVLWIDMPLGSLCSTLNHEYGHIARMPADVTGRRVELRVSAPLFMVEGSAIGQWSRPSTSLEKLAVQSGGWEADRLALLRTREMLYSRERTDYVDALSYSMSKIHTTIYLLRGTEERRLNPQTEEDWHWDPLLYARWMAEIDEGHHPSPPGFQGRARAIHRAAYWNLADFTFLATTFGWVKGHIVDGRTTLPAPWLRLGPVGLAPSVMYTLTPIGPEHTVLTGVRVGQHSGDLHVRWTDPLQGQRALGGGAVWRVGRPGALLESITVDGWRNPSRTFGGRIEVGGEWRRAPEDRVSLRWSVGGKSRGYLMGFSDSPRIYAAVGLRALF